MIMELNKIKRPKTFYKDVGLVLDPNKIKKGKRKSKRKGADTSKFVQELEEKAAQEPKRKFKFGKTMSEELAYYMEKYGEDYEAMARDRKNVYQDSPGQIKAKIKKHLAIQERQAGN